MASPESYQRPPDGGSNNLRHWGNHRGFLLKEPQKEQHQHQHQHQHQPTEDQASQNSSMSSGPGGVYSYPNHPRDNGRHRHSTGGSGVPQLTSFKKQWDVEQDIPSGTVRNSPFSPKSPMKQQHPSPPVVLHQKKQWDTREIPRGVVTSRVLSTQGSPGDDVNEPQSSSSSSGVFSPNRQSFAGTSSPGRLTATKNKFGNEPVWAVKKPTKLEPFHRNSSKTTTTPEYNQRLKQESPNSGNRSRTSGEFGGVRQLSHVPNGKSPTALRGRLIENPSMSSSQPKKYQSPVYQHPEPSSSPSSSSTSKWEPSLEIPKGTVQGRKGALFGTLTPSNRADALPVLRRSPKKLLQQQQQQDRADDEDPWIIPSKTSLTSQQFSPGDWGEAVAAKSSQESEDWDEPPGKEDWYQFSEFDSTGRSPKASVLEVNNAYRNNNNNITTSSSKVVGGGVTKGERRYEVTETFAKVGAVFEATPSASVTSSETAFSVMEEKKMNDDESLSGNRDADVLELAKKKKVGVLQAAKSKLAANLSPSLATRMSPWEDPVFGEKGATDSGFSPSATTSRFQDNHGDVVDSVSPKFNWQGIINKKDTPLRKSRPLLTSNANEPALDSATDAMTSAAFPSTTAEPRLMDSTQVAKASLSFAAALQGRRKEEGFNQEDSSDYDGSADDLNAPCSTQLLSSHQHSDNANDEGETTISEMTLPTVFKDAHVPFGVVSSTLSRNHDVISNVRTGDKGSESMLGLQIHSPENKSEIAAPYHRQPLYNHEKTSGGRHTSGPRPLHVGTITIAEALELQENIAMESNTVDPFGVNSPTRASGHPLDPHKIDLSKTAFGDPLFSTSPKGRNIQPELDRSEFGDSDDLALEEARRDHTVKKPTQQETSPVHQMQNVVISHDRVTTLAKQWEGSRIVQPQVGDKKRKMEKVRKYSQLSIRQVKQDESDASSALPNTAQAAFPSNRSIVKATRGGDASEYGPSKALLDPGLAPAISNPPRIERTALTKQFLNGISTPQEDASLEYIREPTDNTPLTRFRNRQAKIMHSMAESNKANKKKQADRSRNLDGADILLGQGFTLKAPNRALAGEEFKTKQEIGSFQPSQFLTALHSEPVPRKFSSSHRMREKSLYVNSGIKSQSQAYVDSSVPSAQESQTSAAPWKIRDALPMINQGIPSVVRSQGVGRSSLLQGSNQELTKRELPIPIQPSKDVGNNSYRSTDSNSSVGSDIRVLRSILRRPRRAPASGVLTARPSKDAFAVYDEKAITDPMQRAGLRLLSAAIIPIQTEVRRFLSIRRALTRMWALIVIQTYSRSWIERKRYLDDVRAIITVQAIVRGQKARSILQYETSKAIEIQRYMRGYLATMRVYEEIYKVTIIQSFVRMKLAIDNATHRMAAIILIQSRIRGFRVRREFQEKRAGAIVIQSSWRCFLARLGYQFNLLDIIIVQSAWRRRCGSRVAAEKRYERWVHSATVIQSQWRSYDCTMNYLHYLADVLVVQSAVRRFLAMKCVSNMKLAAINQRNLKEYYSARTIQTRWRGYICYHGAKAYFAARRIQATWRGNVAFRDANAYFAARRIQATWRGYVAFRDATGALAARLIQAHWRGYLCYRRAKKVKAATRIQSYWRRFACVHRANMYFSARSIQACWRGYARYRDTTKYFAARVVQARWRAFVQVKQMKRYYAAREIQRCWRGYVCVMDKKEYYAARRIQSAWRSFVCYADFMFTVADIVIVQKLARRWLAVRSTAVRRNSREIESVKTIQTAWRNFFYARKIQRAWTSYRFHTKRETAATVIQKNWRCFVDETEFVVMKYESYAARMIQTYWRRFWCFSNFIIALDCSIQIQATFRGFRQRRLLHSQHKAANSIQSGYRVFIARQDVSRMSMIQALGSASNAVAEKHSGAACLIQRIYRGNKVRYAVHLYQSARKIQKVVRGRQARIAVTLYLGARAYQKMWRGFHQRRKFKVYLGARAYQKVWRGYHQRRKFKAYIAARRIQNCWRCKYLSSKYRRYRAATVVQSFWRYKMLSHAYKLYRSALKIQTQFRRFKARQDVLVYKGELVAATLIQSAWRGFVCYTDYIFTIADIVAVQKIVRGFVARSIYSDQIRSRIMERQRQHDSSSTIQKQCRGLIARQRYWYTLGCTMQIQSWIRGRLVVLRLHREDNARIVIQSFFRMCKVKLQFPRRRPIKARRQDPSKTRGAIRIPDRFRSKHEAQKADRAARVIQRFFLMVKMEVDRMVWAAKRRREGKTLKSKSNQSEDALLEDAWVSAMSFQEGETSFHHLSGTWTKSDVLHDLDLVSVHPTSEGGRKGYEVTGSKKRGTRKSARVNVTSEGNLDDLIRKQRPPRAHSDKPASVVGLPEDDRSELSGLTSSTVANYLLRTPQSRRDTLSKKEIDEDLDLEEAFIDAEIHSAKERRRMADKRSRLAYPILPASSKRSQQQALQHGDKSQRRRVKVSATTTN
jgi:hypothetical protein